MWSVADPICARSKTGVRRRGCEERRLLRGTAEYSALLGLLIRGRLLAEPPKETVLLLRLLLIGTPEETRSQARLLALLLLLLLLLLVLLTEQTTASIIAEQRRPQSCTGRCSRLSGLSWLTEERRYLRGLCSQPKKPTWTGGVLLSEHSTLLLIMLIGRTEETSSLAWLLLYCRPEQAPRLSWLLLVRRRAKQTGRRSLSLLLLIGRSEQRV